MWQFGFCVKKENSEDVIIVKMRLVSCADEPADEENEDKENEMPVDSKEKKRKRVWFTDAHMICVYIICG